MVLCLGNCNFDDDDWKMRHETKKLQCTQNHTRISHTKDTNCIHMIPYTRPLVVSIIIVLGDLRAISSSGEETDGATCMSYQYAHSFNSNFQEILTFCVWLPFSQWLIFKKSLSQLRSKTGGSLGENGNFPRVPGHQAFVENCRLTTLFSKI